MATKRIDRVHCGQEEPWNKLLGATLNEVKLYADSSHSNRLVVGAHHDLTHEGEKISFWIGTGSERGIFDHDDLWVSLGLAPINLDALFEVYALKA